MKLTTYTKSVLGQADIEIFSMLHEDAITIKNVAKLESLVNLMRAELTYFNTNIKEKEHEQIRNNSEASSRIGEGSTDDYICS